MKNYDELRKLAEAAIDETHVPYWFTVEALEKNQGLCATDAEFVVVVSPSKVIELLDAIQELQADRDEWKDSTIAANQNAASEESRRRVMQLERDEYQQAADDMAAGHKVERDGLLQHNNQLVAVVKSHKLEIDELRAKLAALEGQEPVAYGCRSSDGVIRDCVGPDGVMSYETSYNIPLYLAAGAAPPAQPDHLGDANKMVAQPSQYGSQELQDLILAKLTIDDELPEISGDHVFWSLENPKTQDILDLANHHACDAQAMLLAKLAGHEPVALPMDTAPTNGTMVRLLVDFEDNSLEDTDIPVWTVGACYASDSEGDIWQFAGWNWSHDCFTEGHGNPIGWLPMIAAQPAQDVNAELVYGFNRDDLAAVADGLEADYESAVDVGDASVESSTAYAARFIRSALANAKVEPQGDQQ
jgi:hypothetical protein